MCQETDKRQANCFGLRRLDLINTFVRSSKLPTYSFRNNDTNEEWEEFMTNSEREEFLANNPNMESFITGAPLIHSGRGMGKPDSGFRDVLKEIHNKHGAGGRVETKINTW